MSKRALIIFSQWFAPAYEAGGPVISLFNLVKGLSKDYTIFVIAGIRQPSGQLVFEDKSLELELAPYNVTIFRGEGQKFIFQTLKKLWQKEYHYSYYYNDVFMPSWFLIPRVLMALSGREGEKQVLATRGMLLPGALQQKAWKKKIFFSLFQFYHYWFPVHFHFTGLKEQQAASKILNAPFFDVIPNLPPVITRIEQVAVKQKDKLIIGLVGRIHPIKNLIWIFDVLEDIVSPGRIGFEISFFGHVEDEKYQRELQNRANKLKGIKTYFHGGFHPNEQQNIFASFDVLCCPSLSENYGQSIAQALAFGVPVIASQNTPWIGLEEAKAGFTIDPEMTKGYSDKIMELVHKGEKDWEELRDGVIAYANNKLNYNKQLEAYQMMFGFAN